LPSAQTHMAAPDLERGLSQLGDNAYEVIIPPGSIPGDVLRVTAAGKDYKITVPEGAEPGMALVFEGTKKKPAAEGESTPKQSAPEAPKADVAEQSAPPAPEAPDLIRATVEVAKNIGRQLSFQRKRKPAKAVPADAIRVTKPQPMAAAIEAAGDKPPADLLLLPDQFAKVAPRDKAYWKFAIPSGWAVGVDIEVEMPSRLKLCYAPPRTAVVGQALAFAAPRSEGILIESGNNDLKGIGDVVDEEGLLGAAVKITKNIGRQLSFGRKRKPKEGGAHGAPTFREVDVYKPKGESLGISLALPADVAQREGVVVTQIVPGSVVAKGKRIKAGDLVHAVNGVKVTSVEHATQLLGAANGMTQLVITRANALPKGWVEKTEGGATYWVHVLTEQKSYTHPAAIRHNADDMPVSLGDRFRGAVRKIQLISGLQGMEDNDDVDGDDAAFEPAFVQVQRTTRI